MNTEFFIAKRVFFEKEKNKGISGKIVTIAVASISLSLAVMIISVSILIGFKQQVREKVIGFGSHFQVVNFDSNSSFETVPIKIDSTLIKKYNSFPYVKHLQMYATKPGIIKTDDEIHGMVIKGVDSNYDLSFFKTNLIDGDVPLFNNLSASNDVLISEKIALKLQLKTGDPLYCYFFNEGEKIPRNRKFNIKGIYRTSLDEFDRIFIISDIKNVQKLNEWDSTQISGYEIQISNFKLIDKVFPTLQDITMNNTSEESTLKVFSITKKYSMIFAWLSVLDMNVWVLLVLMIGVAGINMISGLLIIILERTRMIGVLKALGYPNFKIRKVFLYLSGFLSVKGLLWGNITGIGFCLFQYYTGAFKLDPASYYLDTVPISMNFIYILFLNIGTLISIICMINLPSLFISKITPAEAISVE